MAGHMGVERVTTQNLKVAGTVPARRLDPDSRRGPRLGGGYVRITDAVKRKLPKEAPFPAAPARVPKPRRRRQGNDIMKLQVKTLDNADAGSDRRHDAVFGLPSPPTSWRAWSLAVGQAPRRHHAPRRSARSPVAPQAASAEGVGHVRHGSTRSPQWRKGAVIFGPTPRSHAFDLPKKVRKLALRTALSSSRPRAS